MPLHVERQVVGAGEGAFADAALERLGAGVFSVVARQFVRAGEAPLAFRPLAVVRFLTSVYPLVSLQVGAFRVHLGTAGEVAVVDPPLLKLGVVALVVPGAGVVVSRRPWSGLLGTLSRVRWRRRPPRRRRRAEGPSGAIGGRAAGLRGGRRGRHVHAAHREVGSSHHGRELEVSRGRRGSTLRRVAASSPRVAGRFELLFHGPRAVLARR